MARKASRRRLSEGRLETLLHLSGVGSMFFLFCGFVAPLFALYSAWLSLAASAVCMALFALGYFLQSALCRAVRFERAPVGAGYESDRKYFDGRIAAPIFVLALLVGGVACAVARSVLRRVANETVGMRYDADSLIPWVVGGLAAAAMIFGSVLWFYPWRRIVSLRTATVGSTLLLIGFFLFAVGGVAGRTASALCLLFYVVCMAMLLNQEHISRRPTGEGLIQTLSPKAREYNFRLVLILLCVFLLFAGGIYVIFVGVGVLGKMFLYLLFNAGSSDPENVYRRPEEVAEDYSRVVFGAKTPAASYTYYLFLIFAVGLVLLLVYLAVRRIGAVRALIARIKQWLAEMLSLLFDRVDRSGARKSQEAFINFKDSEKKIQRAKINPYERRGGGQALYYRDFERSLEALPTLSEKIHFAYLTLLSQIKRQPLGIRSAFTPRQVALRLALEERFCALGRATDAVERVIYDPSHAEQDPAGEDALRELCLMVREFMI